MLSKSDPFVEPHYKISAFEERIIQRLDELSVRLTQDGFDRNEILNLYANKNFRIERDILRIYSKGRIGRPMSYEEYRRRHGIDRLIKLAPIFYNTYAKEIEEAAREYNFDSRQIVSTVAIETVLATFLGNCKAFNAIAALYASDRKKEFGYKQMKPYIQYCKEKKVDVYTFSSSIAGAMGYPQIIPQNLKRYCNERNPMNLVDSFHIIARFHKDAGWDPRQNHKIPQPGSRNWKAIHTYNNSDNYVRARNELAANLKIRPVAIRAVPSSD
jgi:membrane-bound lytic murein transglycosylase B